MWDSEVLKFSVPAVVAVVGWFAAHQFNVYRDRVNKRRELRIQYLLDAYRRLEFAANRPEAEKEHKMNFESAIADIQLLGDKTQNEELMRFLAAYMKKDGSALIDPLLETLRGRLRQELGIKGDIHKVIVFRFS